MNYNICAIVTLYYPDKSVLVNIEKLEEQVSIIIITDNTPDVDNNKLFESFTKVKYIANKKNYGLSIAFNKCLKLELVKKSDYILFFDQDSLITEDLIKKLITNYNKLLEEKINVGCIGPFCYEENMGKIMIPKKKHKVLPYIYEVYAILTSSMLTTYKNLEKINFWNENIFLDLADWDLCWRFKAVGLKCCIAEDVILNHKLGESVKQIGPFSVNEFKPIREYYQTRDCLKLLIRSYTPVKNKIIFLFSITIHSIIRIIILPGKKLRIKYIFFGILDFFRTVNGPFESRKNRK